MIEQWLYMNFNTVIKASGGTEMRVDCPFCDARQGRADTKQHLYVNVNSLVAHCFRCNWSGNHISLIMNMTGCSYAEAILEVEQPKPNVALFGRPYNPRGLQQETLEYPPNFEPLSGYAAESGRERAAALRYLHSRNVEPELISRSFGTVAGTNRVWIIIDRHYWQGRHLIKGIEPKYVNPPWPKADAIWNWQILGKSIERLYICEGVFSAIAAGPHAIALLGKSATSEQIVRIINAKPEEIVLCLDKGAEREALQLAEQLIAAGFPKRLRIHWLYESQPDDSMSGLTEEWDFSTQVKRRLSPVAV